MAIFELSVSSAYVPTWGVYEGVREFIQNALDGRDAGHAMRVHYDTRKQMLCISNTGVTLDRSVWMLGTSSKTDGNARGIFGEGLALGALALTRAGRKVRIINDTEDWACTLEDSKAFPGQQALTVRTRKRPEPLGSFAVHIECSQKEWDDYQSNFLALREQVTAIATDHGSILTDDSQHGRVYVGGILVKLDDQLAAGYDFKPADVRTDRDRRMVNDFDFKFHAGSAWIDAVASGDITPYRLLSLLIADTPDARAVSERYCPQSVMNEVADAWIEAFGEKVIPVADRSAADKAGHLGLHGQISGQAVYRFFYDHPRLSLDLIKDQCRSEITATYGILNLTCEERRNLQLSIQLIDAVAPAVGLGKAGDRVQVVDFRAEDLLGVHRQEDGLPDARVFLARKVLASFQQCIRVLVHEIAHDAGTDGSVSHERAEGQLFAAIVDRLAGALLQEITPELAAA
jgi:hypothetical protein